MVDYLRREKINFVGKYENPANVLEARPIEDFLSILKGEVYEDGWKAENYRLLNSSSNRLNNFIEKR